MYSRLGLLNAQMHFVHLFGRTMPLLHRRFIQWTAMPMVEYTSVIPSGLSGCKESAVCPVLCPAVCHAVCPLVCLAVCPVVCAAVSSPGRPVSVLRSIQFLFFFFFAIHCILRRGSM